MKCMGSRLQGHPAMHLTPGLEGCTGALSEGLSYANGMALAAQILGSTYRVYCLIGDGELHEGQIWEAAMTAAKHCLGHVIAIIDRNRPKAMDAPDCSKSMDPMAARWASFGWAFATASANRAWPTNCSKSTASSRAAFARASFSG